MRGNLSIEVNKILQDAVDLKVYLSNSDGERLIYWGPFRFVEGQAWEFTDIEIIAAVQLNV